MYTHPNLPKAIRAVCKANHLSQSQLAALAGVSTATVRKMLAGGEVKLTAIVGLASAMKMNATQFMKFLDGLDAEGKPMTREII